MASAVSDQASPGSAAAAWALQRCAIGTLTPSGNTVVERITQEVLRDLPEVAALFSRTPVHGSRDPCPDAYATDGLLSAARLLAHAAPDVLVWNGSKGAAIGFEHDRALADAITGETGIRSTTSMLALAALCRARGIERVAVVTPYDAAGQRRNLDGLQREGFQVVADAFAGLSDNLSYAGIPLGQIVEMARRVAVARPQALLCLCTNFPAAVLAAPLEAELGLPVLDSAALGVWHALRLAGIDTTPAAPRWGRLFAEALP